MRKQVMRIIRSHDYFRKQYAENEEQCKTDPEAQYHFIETGMLTLRGLDLGVDSFVVIIDHDDLDKLAGDLIKYIRGIMAFDIIRVPDENEATKFLESCLSRGWAEDDPTWALTHARFLIEWLRGL